MKREKDWPLVVWELCRPWTSLSLPNVTGVSDSLLILQMLVHLTEQEIDTIDDKSCIPSDPVVLDIDHAGDIPREDLEDMLGDFDSDVEFSDVDVVVDGREENNRK